MNINIEELKKTTRLLQAAEVVLMCQIQGKPIPPKIQAVWNSREKVNKEAMKGVEKCTKRTV